MFIVQFVGMDFQNNTRKVKRN